MQNDLPLPHANCKVLSADLISPPLETAIVSITDELGEGS